MRTRVFVVAGALALCVPVAFAGDNRPAGDLDASFGKRGKQFLRPSKRSDAFALAVQPDRKVVLAGSISDRQAPPENADFLVLRLNRNGALDRSFGTAGFTRTPIALGETRAAFAHAADLGPDGRIVVAGTAYKNVDEADLALARYLPSGVLDTSFAGDGIQTLDTGIDDASDVVVQHDGKVVGVAGGWGSGFVVMRLLSDGTPDESFGSRGIVATKVGDPSLSDQATAVIVLGDGKLVVAGAADVNVPYYAPSPRDFAVVRYLPDGNRDPTFGEDGVVVTPGGEAEYASDLLVAPDGKIVVVGTQGWPSQGPRYPPSWRFHLARYLPSGALDPTFGVGGRVSTSSGRLAGVGDYSNGDSVALEFDGKILAGGAHHCWFSCGGEAGFALARYNDDGSLDETFGGGGKLTYRGPWGFPAVGIQRSAARSGADRLVAAGLNFYDCSDTEVTAIGVDLGPPPPLPPPVRCRVPRVVGLTLRRARARIRSAHAGSVACGVCALPAAGAM